jgi:hypothetical protein
MCHHAAWNFANDGKRRRINIHMTKDKIDRLLTLRWKLGDYLETTEQGFDLTTDTAEIFYEHDGHTYVISIEEPEHE